jgi:hypothetical protein
MKNNTNNANEEESPSLCVVCQSPIEPDRLAKDNTLAAIRILRITGIRISKIF